MDNFHKSVLLKEAVDLLQVAKGKKYIDATLGGGGHTREILQRGGEILGIDTDQDALNYVSEFKVGNSEFAKNLAFVKGNFKDIEQIAKQKGYGKVSGIIFDLGVSSHQIDTTQRGFSFLQEGPLDMRMDADSSLNAEYLVNVLDKEKLYEIFKNFGQETRANAIARTIVSRRKMKAIKTTSQLVDVIRQAYGLTGVISDFQKNRISQKVFQALRIAVNNELENLRSGLYQALNLLDTNGVLAVIAFHSLEDRIVKSAFRDFEERSLGQIITKKPIIATEEEIVANRRAISAKLRAFKKI